MRSLPAGVPSLLDRLGESEDVAAIDLALARMLAEHDPERGREIALTAALVSSQGRSGHSAVALGDWGGRAFPGARERLPEADAWRAALDASPVVGGPDDDTRPLVLDGEHVALHRLWAAEGRVAAALASRLGATEIDADTLRVDVRRPLPRRRRGQPAGARRGRRAPPPPRRRGRRAGDGQDDDRREAPRAPPHRGPRPGDRPRHADRQGVRPPRALGRGARRRPAGPGRGEGGDPDRGGDAPPAPVVLAEPPPLPPLRRRPDPRRRGRGGRDLDGRPPPGRRPPRRTPTRRPPDPLGRRRPAPERWRRVGVRRPLRSRRARRPWARLRRVR